ncbi:MAG: DUF4339 domain-containing protein [Planctomycetes bacterium]|nr:DUF4339 domain-containing protein [Planctomycetota bacterium]
MTNPADHWYLLFGEQTIGPIRSYELEKMIAAGQVTQETLLWQPGFTQWLPASQTGWMAGVDSPAPPPIANGMQPPLLSPTPPATALPLASRVEPQSPWPETDRWPCSPIQPRSFATGAPSPYRSSLLVVTTSLMLIMAAGAGWFARGLVETKSVPQRGDSEQQARGSVASSPSQRSFLESVASRGPSPTGDIRFGSLQAGPPTGDSVAQPVVDLPVERSDSSRAEELPSLPATAPGETVSLHATESPSPSAAPERATQPNNERSSSTELPPAPRATPAVAIFQEIDIERRPKFNILGTELAQQLHYKIVSELRVASPITNGNRHVVQTVVDTRLLAADELSRADFERSLQGLKGWQCSYVVRPDGEVRDLAANPEFAAKARAVEPKGGKGFLVTSVMDPDGWREMAEWTFLVPPEAGRGTDSWTRRMGHDYGEFGSWYGDTRFQRGPTRNSLQQISFQHRMTYSPPARPPAGLPFTIREIRFATEVAQGALEYDLKTQRVRAAQEQFLVRGVLTTELLGESASIEVEEQQSIKVTLYEQHRPSPGE